MSTIEEEKARHEYLLMEIRLGNEDVKEYVRETIKPIEVRTSSLEHTRTLFGGILMTIGAIFGWTWIKKG